MMLNNAVSRIDSDNQLFNPDVSKTREEQGISAKYTLHENLLEIASSQLPQPRSTHQVQLRSRSPLPRYPSLSEYQQFNPALTGNVPEGLLDEQPHPEVEPNDEVDVIVQGVQEERHKYDMEAALEEWQADLHE